MVRHVEAVVGNFHMKTQPMAGSHRFAFSLSHSHSTCESRFIQLRDNSDHQGLLNEAGGPIIKCSWALHRFLAVMTSLLSLPLFLSSQVKRLMHSHATA